MKYWKTSTVGQPFGRSNAIHNLNTDNHRCASIYVAVAAIYYQTKHIVGQWENNRRITVLLPHVYLRIMCHTTSLTCVQISWDNYRHDICLRYNLLYLLKLSCIDLITIVKHFRLIVGIICYFFLYLLNINCKMYCFL